MTNLFKKFLKYTSLNILGMMGVSCYVLADTFFIAKAFGPEGIVGLNLTIPIYCLMSAIGLMIGIGGSTKFNILKSLDKNKEAYHMFSSCAKVGLLISLLFTITGIFFGNPLTNFLGANEDTFRLTNIYLKTILIFAPGFILNNIFTVFSRNDGFPRLSMTAMLLGSFINIILDYIFIFVFNMGMFGAAFATGLSAVISVAIITFSYILNKRKVFLLREKILKIHILDSLRLGFPTFIVEISAAILTAAFNFIILDIRGNLGVAAYGIVTNISFIIFSIFNGLSQGIQPLIGEGYGRGNYRDVNKVFKYGFFSAVFLAFIIYFSIFINARNLAGIFTEEGNVEVLNLSMEGMKIYFFGYFFSGINMVIVMYLSATEKIRKAFIISISRGIVLSLPLVVILGETLGMTGIWLSFVLTEFIVLILAIFLIKSDYNKIILP